jgi:hypothetical protein
MTTDFYDQFMFSLKLKSKNFYSRYGQTLNISKKNVRSDATVSLTSLIPEIASAQEEITVDSVSLTAWPTSGAYIDSALCSNGFYPGYGSAFMRDEVTLTPDEAEATETLVLSSNALVSWPVTTFSGDYIDTPLGELWPI